MDVKTERVTSVPSTPLNVVTAPDVVKLVDSVQSIPRTSHSTKPEKFRQIIDTLYPNGKRLEMFARREVKGWNTYGYEVKDLHEEGVVRWRGTEGNNHTGDIVVPLAPEA